MEGARVDPPHTLGDPVAAERAPDLRLHEDVALHEDVEPSNEAIQPPATDFPTLRMQAEQIATYLRKRQRDLDVREARLNGQLAEYDNQVRSARGWFLERREELLAREGQIAEIEAQLAVRQAEVDPIVADLARREADLKAAEQELSVRQEAHERQAIVAAQEIETQREAAWQPIRKALAQLEERRESVEDRAAGIDVLEQDLARRAAGPLPEELARAAELDAREASLATRERQMAESEKLLNHGQARLAELRAQVDSERQRLADQSRIDRRRLAEVQRTQEAELVERRQALERSSEQLDHRRAALTQSQAEVGELHREALELRLATEELWSELAVTVPPAALASALAATRARLADHYKLERGEIARQKAELEELASELAAQHEHLKGQTSELQDWLAGRQAELERQAAALVAREQELDREQTERRQAEIQWLGERFDLDQEVRRLTAELAQARGSRKGESRFAEV